MPEYLHKLSIITGRKNAGKTRLCLLLRDCLVAKDRAVSGIISPGIYQRGRKIGILAEDVASGERKQIASFSPGWDPQKPGREWFFDMRAIEWANEKLKTSVPTDCLIVDELGFLEFEQNRGWIEGIRALDEGQYNQAFAVIRPDLLETAQKRWQGAPVVTVQPGADLPLLAESIFSSFER